MGRRATDDRRQTTDDTAEGSVRRATCKEFIVGLGGPSCHGMGRMDTMEVSVCC